MNKRKICVVITARPSYSRVKSALIAINKHKDLELLLVLAGSAVLDKYGNVAEIIEKDGFQITEKIYNIVDGNSVTAMAKTTGVAILELSTAFNNLEPDVVVTIADRFETIATSIAASYQNIPLVHIQGGEVTGNIDEKVRHANTKLADLHLVSSEDARKRVIKMGEMPSKVLNTGCPSIDIAQDILTNSKIDFNPFEKYSGVGSLINWHEGYLVVLQHPVTTEYDESLKQIQMTLSVIDKLNIPTFWFWPNVDAGSDGTSSGIRKYREANEIKNVHFFKNFEPTDFLKLLKNSKCLIGNSSVGIRECGFLGVPVVNIGSRQDGRSRALNVYDCGYNEGEIMKGIKYQINHGQYNSQFVYGNGSAGIEIAKALATFELDYHKKITY